MATVAFWNDGGNTTGFTSMNLSRMLTDCNDNLTKGDLNAEFVYKIFGQCIYNPRQYAAFYIGMSSILCWLLATAP